MSEALALLGLTAGFLALLAALGSGPALALGRGLEARAALAPVLGLAIAASFMVSAGLLVPAETAAFALLAPAAILSLGWAVAATRRAALDSQATKSDLWPVAAIVLGGSLVAASPGVIGGTVGPVSLAHFDVWAYVPAAEWLQSNSIGDGLPVAFERGDTLLGQGWSLTECGCRLGPTEVQAAGSSLMGTEPDSTSLAFLAALFGLLPASVWFAARNLGAGRLATGFGAIFALSPALLLFVADSTLGTLSGLVVAPAAVVLAFRAPGSSFGPVVLAGLLLGGLVALYPEFAPAFVAVCALGAACAAVGRRRHKRLSSDWLWDLSQPVAGTIAIAALSSPVALQRAISYFGEIDSIQIELPRYLSPENAGAWAFGVLHLYELRRFGELPFLATFAAVAIPLALVALLAFGIWRAPSRAAFSVAGPLAVAAGLGLYVYFSYGDGRCQYCLFKSLTFALPFLAVGLALGFQRLLGSRGNGRPAAAVLALVALAAIARSDAALTRAQDLSPARIGGEERDLTAAIEDLDGPRSLLLEGMDATAVPSFSLPAAYEIAGEAEGTLLSYDARSAAAIALIRPLPAEEYLSPDYRYVVSTFPGIDSGRELISRHGIYALLRRAPYDVAVSRPGWAFDPGEGENAIPWLQGPVRLLVASPRAGRAALRIGFGGPRAATTAISVRGPGLSARASGAAAPICIPLQLRRGLNPLTLTPRFGTPHPTLWPALQGVGVAFTSVALFDQIRPESEAVPPPPKLLALEQLRAEPGGCGR